MTCARVLFLGTGAAMHPYRWQSSVAVDLEGMLVLVDAGCAAPRFLAAAGYQPADVDYVLVTHMHWDHFCGVPMIAFLASYQGVGEIKVAVPAEEGERARMALAAVRGGLPIEPRIIPLRPSDHVARGAARAWEADHGVPALSYEISAAGLRIVVSGDTRPTPVLRERASGASLLVHEATYPSHMREKAVARRHSTVDEALRQGEESASIALYHLTLESEAEAYKHGSALVPADGSVVKVC